MPTLALVNDRPRLACTQAVKEPMDLRRGLTACGRLASRTGVACAKIHFFSAAEKNLSPSPVQYKQIKKA